MSLANEPMIITDLFIYPIKSCQGIALKAAEITPKGLAWDREMMVVDKQGQFITQRQFPQLAMVKIQIQGFEFNLSAINQPSLTFQPSLEGLAIEVEVWGDRIWAIDQGEAVAQWFANLLQLPKDKSCRLVRQSPDHPRGINPTYRQKDGESVSFADGFPLLLTNNASLAELNQRLADIYSDQEIAIPMNRFRPNVVVDCDRSFAEDDWFEISLGEIPFTAVKPCTRCIITTTDQTTGERNPRQEPLRILQTFRQSGKDKLLFGENLIPQGTGVIKICDRVQIHSLKSARS